jgi:hypothetical protein
MSGDASTSVTTGNLGPAATEVGGRVLVPPCCKRAKVPEGRTALGSS